jgi:isopentenyl phosphate kinase
MSKPIFLKLGGSLITDKTGVEAVRTVVLADVCAQIAAARRSDKQLRFVLGHGSGSFGHVAAAEFNTRQGVRSQEQWRGFAIVSDSAARLNRIVIAALLSAGIPAVSMQPSAIVLSVNGHIDSVAMGPIKAALESGVVPVVYGDVAFDLNRGGTIVSTEEILAAMAAEIEPDWLLLAGETDGVLDENNARISLITPGSLAQVVPALGGSRGTDVTGGMLAKVQTMLELLVRQSAMQIRIFSGLEPGAVAALLSDPDQDRGTRLCGH